MEKRIRESWTTKIPAEGGQSRGSGGPQRAPKDACIRRRSCAHGRGALQPLVANPGGRPGRGGACGLRLRASSFLHTHEYKEPYDLRVSFFHFFPSLSFCVCSKFLKIDICGSVGVRKLAKGNLRVPPFLFLSLLLFLFPGQGFKYTKKLRSRMFVYNRFQPNL